MSDKAIDEFEQWFMEAEGIAHKEDVEAWLSKNESGNYVNAEINLALCTWLAAKERYEPRWIPVSERLPEIDQYVAWVDYHGLLLFTERDKDDQAGYWEARFTHWAVIEAPSTQGGGE